ncbi:YpjP family protein [Aquibacillus kalidii]|uniref:YpjP family protein n=1 Tax=Aquibacillus kalidii TaxID=2762597 RepID=UPI00164758AD|nr:YpjP family protein [Aquibacillus kalidii]
MRLWLKKISVVLITFMTLGIYIPPTYLEASVDNEELVSTENDTSDRFLEDDIDTDDVEEINLNDQYISTITEQAKLQTVSKLGPKITKQVEDEFTTLILPNIEAVVKSILEEAEEEVPYFAITEQPSSGYGEKIFNIYNYRTKQDIARFHVRRVNRPQEGYYFNFHYHVSTDGFEEHHDIGEIYWDKNTPPKWMS